MAGVRVQVSTHVLDLPLETLLAALFSALPRARAYHNEGEERREERGTYALLVRWAKQDVHAHAAGRDTLNAMCSRKWAVPLFSSF